MVSHRSFVHETRIDGLSKISCSQHVVSFELVSIPIGDEPGEVGTAAFRACMDIDDFFKFVSDLQAHADEINKTLLGQKSESPSMGGGLAVRDSPIDSGREKDNKIGERIG